MDSKKLILSVAGSGKTSLLIENCNLTERILLLTYTNNNLSNLRTRLIDKFGFIPQNIKLYSYFEFVYSFCFRPLLAKVYKTKGLNWTSPNIYSKGIGRYIDNYSRLYSNRISKLLEEVGCLPEVNSRIDKYFDALLIDEIQDFGGNDFNLLKAISQCKANLLFVGDFYQHTFDTSRDGRVNATLHSSYPRYNQLFIQMRFIIDDITLLKSWRCSPIVCNFLEEKLNIRIQSHRQDVTEIEFVDTEVQALEIFNRTDIVKLFYQESYKYSCFGRNWGECKGEDKYFDVCVVVNPKIFKELQMGNVLELAPTTRNKLYVAISRTKGKLYIVSDTHFKKLKLLSPVEMKQGSILSNTTL